MDLWRTCDVWYGDKLKQNKIVSSDCPESLATVILNIKLLYCGSMYSSYVENSGQSKAGVWNEIKSLWFGSLFWKLCPSEKKHQRGNTCVK